MENIIIKNLSVDFDDKKVLKDISLNVNEGDFICVLGKNGSGKSTLVKTLNGLIAPTSGDIYVYGMSIKDQDKIIDIRKTIGLAFQNPDNQIVASIVEEDIAFGLENLGIPTYEIRDRIDTAMRRLGIYNLKGSLTSKLSGGQKQKVSIAGILAMKSKTIVLDEPTSMLDKLSREEMLMMLKELNEKEKITIILISHHIDEMFYANRVLVMDDGKIIIDDIPHEILKKEKELKDIGLDLPYVTRLARALKEKGLDYTGFETEVSEI